MGFTTDEAMVRMDFFKESGKWYDTVSVSMRGYYGVSILEAVVKSARTQCNAYSGMTLVCLEPYHQHSHPVMIQKWDTFKL